MRDAFAVVEEFHEAGLVSDEFVEKLATEISRHVFIKEAYGEGLGQALGAAGQFLNSMAPNAMHSIKGMLGMNPTLGQRIGSGLSSMMENPMGQHLLIGGALGGAQMIKNVMVKAMDNMTMNSSYAQMLQQFPDLQKADPSLVQRTFQVVQQYAPSVAKNPTVAGTFVKGILQYPDASVTPEHVRSLVDVERQMSSMNEPGLIGEMATGAARSLGQSAVSTFAPDPMRVRELKLRENQDARQQSMDTWQKAQMGMNMLGGGVNMAKGVQDLRGLSKGEIVQLQARLRNEGDKLKMDQAAGFHKDKMDASAAQAAAQAARDATQAGQFGLSHGLHEDQFRHQVRQDEHGPLLKALQAYKTISTMPNHSPLDRQALEQFLARYM